MKKFLVMMFAVLFVSAMGMAECNDAWAGDDGIEGAAGAAQGSAQNKVDNSKGGSAGVASSGSSGKSLNWGFNGANFGTTKANGGSNFSALLSTVGVNGGSGSSASVGSVATTGGGIGGGIGGAFGIAGGAAMNLSSNLAGIVVSKLSNIFLDVKTILYVLAAFGLVGFAFMALFGKVRWGWVCALAFGLAAVSAAGQLIDYVSNGGVSSVTADTLGTNMY